MVLVSKLVLLGSHLRHSAEGTWGAGERSPDELTLKPNTCMTCFSHPAPHCGRPSRKHRGINLTKAWWAENLELWVWSPEWVELLIQVLAHLFLSLPCSRSVGQGCMIGEGPAFSGLSNVNATSHLPGLSQLKCFYRHCHLRSIHPRGPKPHTRVRLCTFQLRT